MLLFICALPSQAFCQLIPVSLDQRIENASVVLEGKTIAKNSYWDEGHKNIYTSNTVRTYKVFKGTVTAEDIEIITQGGQVGDDVEEVSHSLQLQIGDTGIFTVVANPVKLERKLASPEFKAYSGPQGFIKYNLDNGTAKDVFTEYSSISAEVYPMIIKRTKQAMKVVRKADFNIN